MRPRTPHARYANEAAEAPPVASAGGTAPAARTQPGAEPGTAGKATVAATPYPAPEFRLKDLEGRDVLPRYDSRPVTVVLFWATHCVPCMRDIPTNNRFAETYERFGAALYAISMDGMSSAEMASLTRRHNIRHTVLLGDEATAKAFGGIDALPTVFVVDGLGRIVEKEVGSAPHVHRRVEGSIRALLEKAGRKLPPLQE